MLKKFKRKIKLGKSVFTLKFFFSANSTPLEAMKTFFLKFKYSQFYCSMEVRNKLDIKRILHDIQIGLLKFFKEH